MCGRPRVKSRSMTRYPGSSTGFALAPCLLILNLREDWDRMFTFFHLFVATVVFGLPVGEFRLTTSESPSAVQRGCGVVYISNETNGELDLGWGDGPSCQVASENARSRHGHRDGFRIVERIRGPGNFHIWVALDSKKKAYGVHSIRLGEYRDSDARRRRETEDRAIRKCRRMGGVDCWSWDIVSHYR